MSEQYKSRTERREKEKQRKQRKNRTKSSAAEKKSWKTIAKRVFLTLLVLGFIGLIAGVSVVAYWISDAPKFDPAALKDSVPSTIYDMNKEPIVELGTEKRDLVSYEEIPELVRNAILATEDVRFFKHNGIDIIRLGGAVLSNITEGFGSQGASTLTQQVVKLSFLSQEKTLKRKVQEAWLAIQLEQHFTKEEIFEMYVNKVNMGRNVYGIKKASEEYFGKSLDELTLPEAAVIAGLPQRPNAYNPLVNPDLANGRKKTVLKLMHQHGFITEKEMNDAQNVDVSDLVVSKEEDEKENTPYDTFIDKVIDEVGELGFNIYTDGLEIYTTMDKGAQEKVYDLLNNDDSVGFSNDEIQAGVILTDTKNGEIRAIGGGRKQTVKRGFNYAIDNTRHPGSTAKPIFGYGPAIEHLKWSPAQILNDEPYKYSGTDTTIRNHDGQYTGNQTMRYHLQWSRNVPAVKAFQEAGKDNVEQFARNLGIPLNKDEYVGESYALGGMENGIAPIHLAGAYAAFGNDGIYNEPHAVRKVVLPDGREIDMSPKSKRVMQDYTAFLITDMLKDVVTSGTGTRAQVPGVPIAGKTGTSNYSEEDKQRWGIKQGGVPDSWFGGYSTNYTAAIWVGYSDRSKALYSPETRIAMTLFKKLMTYVHDGIDTPDFKQPDSVVKVAIEKGSNPPKKASQFTPSSEIYYEYFVKGTEPTEVSTKYDKLPAVTNLSADYNENAQKATLNWNFNSNIKGVSFKVYVSIDGSAEELISTTKKNGLKVENVVPGLKYTFTVYAVKDGNKSDPASVSLDLSTFVEEPDEEEQPDDNSNDEIDQESGNENNEDDHDANESDEGNERDQSDEQSENKNNQGNGNGQDGGNEKPRGKEKNNADTPETENKDDQDNVGDNPNDDESGE